MIANVVPSRFEAPSTVSRGSDEAPVRVVATLPSYLRSSSVEVERGRFISDGDLREFRQVCALGAKVSTPSSLSKIPWARSAHRRSRFHGDRSDGRQVHRPRQGRRAGADQPQ